MRMMDRIRDAFRSRVKEMGITRKELSAQAGYGNTVITDFISGRNDMRMETLENFCELMGLELIVVRKNPEIKQYDFRATVDKFGRMVKAGMEESSSGDYCEYMQVASYLEDR